MLNLATVLALWEKYCGINGAFEPIAGYILHFALPLAHLVAENYRGQEFRRAHGSPFERCCLHVFDRVLTSS
jgi:hypothetical protein